MPHSPILEKGLCEPVAFLAKRSVRMQPDREVSVGNAFEVVLLPRHEAGEFAVGVEATVLMALLVPHDGLRAQPHPCRRGIGQVLAPAKQAGPRVEHVVAGKPAYEPVGALRIVNLRLAGQRLQDVSLQVELHAGHVVRMEDVMIDHRAVGPDIIAMEPVLHRLPIHDGFALEVFLQRVGGDHQLASDFLPSRRVRVPGHRGAGNLVNHRIPSVFLGLRVAAFAVPVRHAIIGREKAVGLELDDIRQQPSRLAVEFVP